ncbi:hypothetical protein [Parasitella parasitica]|uniref:G-protein coupled receptors family 3 profile domain-containing protein n=1 Tax=Parasitella parasitica TaxID=35722 RepID=A0A0B7NDZ7_9FUNG|nr:hypothetical protein [Parasitella parasitica]
MENDPTSLQMNLFHYHKNATDLIDDGAIEDFKSFHCHDTFNNYTFLVSRRRGSTFIYPSERDKSLVELRVGVLLPFHQNNDPWTRTVTLSGVSAIRLAVAEINAQRLIPGAYITLVERDSYPKNIEGQTAITQAVFSAISLIQQGVIGVIGDISSSWTSLSALMTSTLQIPQCSFSAIATSLSDKSQFGHFFRTAPTNLLYSDAAIAFVVSQGWPQLGVFYSNDDFGQQLSENVVIKARMHGIHVKSYLSFYDDGSISDIKKSLDTLKASGVRVIFVAAEGPAQMAAMTIAAHSGYINDKMVWITINADTDTLFAAVNDYNAILARRANNTDVVPDVYKTVANDDSLLNTTKSGRASKKQDLLDLIDPVEYGARTTNNFTQIDFNSTFSGGVFTFDVLKELPGYPPFDAFMDKWSHLDPAIYPYGGRNNISSNEGMAYSCMMVMASGFNQTINNASMPFSSKSDALRKLASGQLGQYLLPSAFNTSYVGPEGPVVLDQNGDLTSGNFKLFNLQNGSQIEIGTIIGGNMNLTSLPIYHDGTTKIPTGVPDRMYLNPGYTSPVTIALLVISSLGAFVALFSMAIVLRYRKQEIFKASRTKLNCTLIPITFHLGYSLILGNLIAKNYRIYRIFNNIFITRTVVTDVQLLRVSGSIFATTSVILIAWFVSVTVSTVNVPVSRTAYYTDCSYEGGVGHTVFITLLTIFGSFQLMFATYLAFKTRSVGRNYSKYSEYKQIGLSVYNIFFSVLIGFIIFFVPTTDYYTRHYLTATMIVWATTFSLLTLFLPKLHAFFFPEKDDAVAQLGKASDLSGRQQHKRSNAVGNSTKSTTNNGSNHDQSMPSRLDDDTISTYLTNLNRMVDNPMDFEADDAKVKLSNMSTKGRMNGIVMEVHETEVPIQQAFKYFPFLAAWDMMSVVLMPKTSRPNEYILKVHGLGMFNVLMQVESEKELIKWNDWFNTRVQSAPTVYSSKASTPTKEEGDALLSSSHPSKLDSRDNDSDKIKKSLRRLTRQSRQDSGLTTHHLLADEDEDYGDDDDDNDDIINPEQGLDQDDKRQSRRANQTILDSQYLHSVSLDSASQRSEEEEHSPNERSSFYASFAQYLNSPPATANAAGSATTVVVPENDENHM